MEHITPAVITSESNENFDATKISSKEFQQQLYTWFQEKGMMLDLKTYIKHQMVNVLRGANLKKSHKSNHSLSAHALNFVVAEYLYRNNCYYSLSIFSSEVDLINMLPESFSEEKKVKRDTASNILELVGISKSSAECLKILEQYYNCNESSLLNCIVDYFINSKNENNKNVCDNIKLEYDQIILDLKNDIDFKQKQIADGNKIIPILYEKLANISSKYKKLKKSSKKHKNIDPNICNLQHCNTLCQNNETNLLKYEIENKNLKTEIEQLKLENLQHKSNYKELKILYDDIVKEIDVYKNKIGLMSKKIDNIVDRSVTVPTDINYYDSCDICDTKTEIICHKSRTKLTELEKESNEMLVNLFSSYS